MSVLWHASAVGAVVLSTFLLVPAGCSWFQNEAAPPDPFETAIEKAETAKAVRLARQRLRSDDLDAGPTKYEAIGTPSGNAWRVEFRRIAPGSPKGWPLRFAVEVHRDGRTYVFKGRSPVSTSSPARVSTHRIGPG